ncbi:MAG: polyprenyl synthetase family protein [Pseudomonadota bacterium]
MTIAPTPPLKSLPDPADDAANAQWMRAVKDRVAQATRNAVLALARSPDQAALFSLGLKDMRLAQPGAARALTSAHLCAALLLDRDAPESWIGPVGAIATLFETGIDIIDNIADRERAPHWAAVPERAATLVGTLFVSGLPMALLADAPVPQERRTRMLATIGRASTAIAQGQLEDYALSGSDDVSVARVEASHRSKTGDRHAMLIRLALEAGGETDEAALAAAAVYGRNLGLALQIRSDLSHLYGPHALRDVRNGTRTWPIAFALQSAAGEDRAELMRLLDPNAPSADALVAWMTAHGVVVAAMLRAEKAAADARATLPEFMRTEAGRAVLERPTQRTAQP